MRYILKSLVVLIGIVALGACYLGGTPQQGNLTFTLPSADQLAQMGPQQVGSAEADTGRVYLAITLGSSTELLEIGEDAPYIEQAITSSDSTVSISPVPTGSGYRIYAAFGSTDGGTFDLAYFAESDPFEVAADDTTDVSIDLSDGVFGTQLAGTELTGLTSSEGVVYASTDGGVYEVAVGDGPELIDETSVTGNINSVTGGGTSSLVLANAEKGIFSLSGGTFTDISNGQYKAVEWGGAEMSTAFPSATAGEQPLAFQTQTGIGFVVDPNNAESWTFFPTNDIVAGKPILDLAVDTSTTDGRAFLATKVGGFMATVEDLGSDELSGDFVNATEVFDFFDQAIGNNLARSIAFDQENGVLYVATTSGAYAVPAGDGADFDSQSVANNLISDVPKNVIDVAVQSTSSGNPYVAFLTKFSLVLYKEGADFVIYPFVAYDELPGNSSMVTFRDTDSNGDDDQVVLAGSDGLSTLDLSDLP
jgi:hypothetical protein